MILKKYFKINIWKYKSHYLEYVNVHFMDFFSKEHELGYFSIFTHKKLNYYRFFYNKKMYIYTHGTILRSLCGPDKRQFSIRIKKKLDSFPLGILKLLSLTNFSLANIFFFFCKNMNYRLYYWIKKFLKIVQPNITHFMVTRCWNVITKKRRRIKRRIFRALIKSEQKLTF